MWVWSITLYCAMGGGPARAAGISSPGLLPPHLWWFRHPKRPCFSRCSCSFDATSRQAATTAAHNFWPARCSAVRHCCCRCATTWCHSEKTSRVRWRPRCVTARSKRSCSRFPSAPARVSGAGEKGLRQASNRRTYANAQATCTTRCADAVAAHAPAQLATGTAPAAPGLATAASRRRRAERAVSKPRLSLQPHHMTAFNPPRPPKGASHALREGGADPSLPSAASWATRSASALASRAYCKAFKKSGQGE